MYPAWYTIISKKHKAQRHNPKGGNIMSDIGKGMLIILVILYIVSPIDFAPGPVDDAIVLLLGLAAAKKSD